MAGAVDSAQLSVRRREQLLPVLLSGSVFSLSAFLVTAHS